MTFDFIIVGGGSAGCVVANRLSAIPGLNVLLIEAGPAGDGPIVSNLVRMPRGVARTLGDPALTSTYMTDWPFQGVAPNAWQSPLIRGRMLGGCSAINGMIYNRGQPQDYDRWAELGNPGWGWDDLLPYFVALERHSLPPASWRGSDGVLPLNLTPSTPLGDAVIAASEGLGLPHKDDPNLLEQRGVSYIAANIDARGRRVTTAQAFLTPEVRRRPNLRIVTDTRVERLLFAGKHVIGVRCRRRGVQVEYGARAEVILCAGAYESPLLLQGSGIGPADRLSGLGIDVVHASDHVGANMQDHWQFHSAFGLKHAEHSENREFQGWRLARNLARYAVAGKGPFATATHQVVGFVDTEGEGRATLQFIMGPYTTEIDERGNLRTRREPTMNFYCCALRATSRGSIMLGSEDGSAPPIIRPNYLGTDYDRRVTVAGARFIRQLVATSPLADLVSGEREPAADAVTDDQLLVAARRSGSFSAHTCGTCRMGPDRDATSVVDPRLRVRGVSGVRVVDASIFPEIISGNTNGPIMAVAMRAADLIREDIKTG